MKKMILKLALAGIFMIATAVNLSIHEKTDNVDVTLSLKNIEALADGESGGDFYCVSGNDCNSWPGQVCVACGTSGNCVIIYEENEVGNSIGRCS